MENRRQKGHRLQERHHRRWLASRSPAFHARRPARGRLHWSAFGVAHDPTQLNRQGPDVGSQYRSAIFYTDPVQQQAAMETIRQLGASKGSRAPVVTQVAPLKQFYPAEAYHQNYLALHPTQPYIVAHDLPKLTHLRQRFPELYR